MTPAYVPPGRVVLETGAKSPELLRVEARELRTPVCDILLLVVALVGSSLLSVLRGQSRKESLLHLPCGSFAYWCLIGAQLAFILLLSASIQSLLMRRHRHREEVHHRATLAPPPPSPHLPRSHPPHTAPAAGGLHLPEGRCAVDAAHGLPLPVHLRAGGHVRGHVRYRRRHYQGAADARDGDAAGGVVRHVRLHDPLHHCRRHTAGATPPRRSANPPLQRQSFPAANPPCSQQPDACCGTRGWTFLPRLLTARAPACCWQYALFGALRLHYASVLFAIGLVGTLCGQFVVKKIIQRTNRQSLIVIIIAVVIGASTALMGGIGVATFIAEFRAGEDQGMRELCVAEAPDR